MVSESAVLTVRSSDGLRSEWFLTAAEARRELLLRVRKNRWTINGNGKSGLLRDCGPGGPVVATYEIRPSII
jgi:hypothetical protein